MIFKNVKMTNRVWYLLIGFIVCCILVAGIVGDMIVHARKDEARTEELKPISTKDIKCEMTGTIKLSSGIFSSVDIQKLIDFCGILV